jgi:hypothetical protein
MMRATDGRPSVMMKLPRVHGQHHQVREHEGGDALQPTSTATCVRIRNGKTLTTDGPFAETKEQLGGYYLIEAKDLDEATKIAARVPSAKTARSRCGRSACSRAERGHHDRGVRDKLGRRASQPRGVERVFKQDGADPRDLDPPSWATSIWGGGAGRCAGSGARAMAARGHAREPARLADSHGA